MDSEANNEYKAMTKLCQEALEKYERQCRKGSLNEQTSKSFYQNDFD